MASSVQASENATRSADSPRREDTEQREPPTRGTAQQNGEHGARRAGNPATAVTGSAGSAEDLDSRQVSRPQGRRDVMQDQRDGADGYEEPARDEEQVAPQNQQQVQDKGKGAPSVRLDMDLDVDIQLKARIQGDLELAVLDGNQKKG